MTNAATKTTTENNMSLENIINNAWEDRANVNSLTKGEVRDSVESILADLDTGKLRVAQKQGAEWVVNQWVKKAVLLSFRLYDNKEISSGDVKFWDKVPTKFGNWKPVDFQKAGLRAVPGAQARRGSFIGKNVILMPSFVNIGAYVDEGTMVDTWTTVGSCAQIGKNCHLSGGVGIGGVLEPLQANPVIIEDNCFIGARSEVAEGVIVETGAVISMGVYLGASTKILNRATGEITYGRIPAYSVVVPGTLPGEKANLYCAVIVKTVDEKTRSKTGINELLRD